MDEPWIRQLSYNLINNLFDCNILSNHTSFPEMLQNSCSMKEKENSPVILILMIELF